MARISIYNLDTNITKQDKVIGTDFSGSITKNFPLDGIAELFGRGLIPIHTQASYKFSDILEDMTFSGPADGANFNAITSLKFSQIDGAQHSIQDFILEYKDITKNTLNKLSRFFSMHKYLINYSSCIYI